MSGSFGLKEIFREEKRAIGKKFCFKALIKMKVTFIYGHESFRRKIFMSYRQKQKKYIYTITAIQETYRRRKTVVSHRFRQLLQLLQIFRFWFRFLFVCIYKHFLLKRKRKSKIAESAKDWKLRELKMAMVPYVTAYPKVRTGEDYFLFVQLVHIHFLGIFLSAFSNGGF